jgi:hypothetical protein
MSCTQAHKRASPLLAGKGKGGRQAGKNSTHGSGGELAGLAVQCAAEGCGGDCTGGFALAALLAAPVRAVLDVAALCGELAALRIDGVARGPSCSLCRYRIVLLSWSATGSRRSPSGATPRPCWRLWSRRSGGSGSRRHPWSSQSRVAWRSVMTWTRSWRLRRCRADRGASRSACGRQPEHPPDLPAAPRLSDAERNCISSGLQDFRLPQRSTSYCD